MSYRDTYQPHLDARVLENISTNAFVGLDDRLDLRQRGNLIELDRQLHAIWSLGKNYILGWTPSEDGITLLVVHHYAIADYAFATASAPPEDSVSTSDPHSFIMRMLTGSRRFELRQLRNAARLLDADLTQVKLRQPLQPADEESQIIDRLIKRYSVSYVASRAVALFDIVGFSLLSPFEQMTQLNSLSHSLNSAHSKMLHRRLNIDFSRSSTGDGFYIWNRDLGIEANTHLYHFMHLVLADNAIARRKAQARTVPLLRTCFHIGSCYEFYQAEGLNPTMSSDIVGDVTIELARMIDRALPGQVMVGEFLTKPAAHDEFDPQLVHVDSIGFVEKAQENLTRLNGLELSGDAIESIKCYLTGRAQADGTFTIRKLSINDKHGLTRNVFNAKINIYRCTGEPILLGIEDRLLRGDELAITTTAHIRSDGESG
ncbi:MAG: hypothetical protein HKN81_08970 [Gammaproteobacteria bacterium]|nr:hypothetical protein [Gammaproteobacteria bacterium]